MLILIPVLLTLMVLGGAMNQNHLTPRMRALLVVLSCAVLALVWFASHMEAPLNQFYDYDRKNAIDGRSWEFVPAAPVETDLEVIFKQGMNGYNTTRIPALVHHQDIFFAFCEARRDTFEDIGEMEIILRRGARRDWKVKWGPVQILARKPGYRMMNPVPIVDTTIDMILLIYNAHPSWVDQWDEMAANKYQTNLIVIKSFDLGETWTDPQEMNHETLGQMKPTPSLYAPGPGHGIQMKSGRLVVPGNMFVKVYHPNQKEYFNGTINQANVIVSDDHGRTWKPGGVVAYGENEATGDAIQSTEPMVVELDDDHLYLNARTLHPDQPRIMAFSQDEGQSFSSGQLAWALEEPGYYPREDKVYTFWTRSTLLEDEYTRPAKAAGCQVVELDNDRLCLNARTLHPDQPRVLAFSQDDGHSFSSGQLAWALEEPGYYPKTNDSVANDKFPWVPFWDKVMALEDDKARPARAAGCQASMVGFSAPHHLSPSKTWVVFSNPASKKFRENMAVRISQDGCRSWSKPWTIWPNSSAYSDLTYFETWDAESDVQSQNFAILFEGGQEFPYETIQFKMFSLERLLREVGQASTKV